MSSSSKDLCRREGGKLVRNGYGEWIKRNSVFMKQQDWCTYELTETVAASSKSTQVQTRKKILTVKRGSWFKFLHWSWRYLKLIPSVWKRENKLSAIACRCVLSATIQGRPHAQELSYIGPHKNRLNFGLLWLFYFCFFLSYCLFLLWYFLVLNIEST